MPRNKFNGHTDLGVGIGLRVPHYKHILSERPTVDWFEIISENFLVDGGRPRAVLDQILARERSMSTHARPSFTRRAFSSTAKRPRIESGR